MNYNKDHMPSILLILPYFGPLPSYAELFFRSCAANPTINQLLITDQQLEDHCLPGNVAVRKTSFGELKKRIDKTLGMETTLATPYKLCDFKPAYGAIFADEIVPYDFWGYCDMDVIFGNIRAFITNEILGQYNKVLIHGHLSFFRNCEEANNYFRLEAPGVSYRDVYTESTVRGFCEFGGTRILLDHHKIPYFRNDRYLADINQNVYRLETISRPNYKHQCFYWEKRRDIQGILRRKLLPLMKKRGFLNTGRA